MADLRGSAETDLANRFNGLMNRLGLASRSRGVFELLAESYAAPDRHYHTLDHIRRCLERRDQVVELLDDPDAVELALWFHDAVHEPGRDDNELRSACLFDRWIGIHLPTPRADAIHAMIMATAHDDDAVDTRDQAYAADIDLAALAVPADDFRRATARLRREHGQLSDSQFERETRVLFEKLLSRPHIYRTDYFRDRCAGQARRNLEHWIASDQSA